MSTQLETVAESQGQWSATATALKKSYERARLMVFGLSTSAALLAAISSQAEQTPRRVLAIASTICMALVTFLTVRLLDSKHTQGWVRVRAASEALKREAYRYAAQAAPYDSADTRDALLQTEVRKIENEIEDFLGARKPAGPSSVPRNPISPQEYIDARVKNQISKFFEPKATQAQAAARKMRTIEFALAMATTVITAIMSVVDKHTFGSFDVVALTAVFTTLSGAIIAYIEASRYDFTVQSYRATARRLRDELTNQPANPQPGTPAWSEFVERCEAILREENNSWIAKFSKPA
jgi:hypothetical protein